MTDSDDVRRSPVTPSERTDEADETDDAERTDGSHLDSVEDGCGCAEVWEHLSEQRDRAREAGEG